MKFLPIAYLLSATIAFAGPPRAIERAWNINDTFDRRDAVEWWKGESVTLTYDLTDNGTDVDLTGLTVLWHITERDIATNLYIVVTGTVGVATGEVEFELTAANSRLSTAERYDGYVRTYDVTNALLRVDVVQSITAHDSPYMGDYEPIGPLTDTEADPVWLAAYAAGLNLSAMTNPPSAWTAAGDAGGWSGYAATQALDMATYDINNAGDIEANSVTAHTSAGMVIKNLGGSTVATFGAGAGTGTTIAGGLNVGGVISGNGSGITNVAETDPVWLSEKSGYASTGYVAGVVAGYLPLTGGYLTGDVNADTSEFFIKDITADTISANSIQSGLSDVVTVATPTYTATVAKAEGALQAESLTALSNELARVSWYPTYTQAVSGTATFAITNGALQLWNVNGAVTNLAWTVADTNAVTPWSIIFNGADTNSITANGISVAGSATTWTNALFRLVGSYYRDTATGGKVWPSVE